MLQKLLSLLLIGLLMAGPVVAFPLNGSGVCPDEDEVEIIVHSNQGESIEPPRTPNTTTIEAWYSWSISSVRASLANAGDSVQVAFNNLSTGEYYSFVINGNGSSVMPISDSSGYWTVSFTLSSGVIYDGFFIL